MDFVEDITPHQLRHASIPNETVDFWERRDLLALGELTSFVRHSTGYGMTLTKLVGRCEGQGKQVLSKSYNNLIEHRYLCRIEFGYARPAGSTERSGQRYSKHVVSRVPITEDSFAATVAKHVPGKYTLIPYGEPNEDGKREQRRVKILSAEIYCHLGAMRIHADGTLSPHEKRRGGGSKASKKRPQPERKTGPSATSRAPESDVSPEVIKPTSGVTCENTENPQVAPEVDPPEFGKSTSIKKDQPRRTEDDHQPLAPSLTLGCAPGETAAAGGVGSTRHDRDESAPEVVATDSSCVGNHQNACVKLAPIPLQQGSTEEPMTRDKALKAIRRTLAKRAGNAAQIA